MPSDPSADLLDDFGRYRLRTPRLPIAVNGAGDAIARCSSRII